MNVYGAVPAVETMSSISEGSNAKTVWGDCAKWWHLALGRLRHVVVGESGFSALGSRFAWIQHTTRGLSGAGSRGFRPFAKGSGGFDRNRHLGVFLGRLTGLSPPVAILSTSLRWMCGMLRSCLAAARRPAAPI